MYRQAAAGAPQTASPRPELDREEPTDFDPGAAARLETVEWRGRALRVPPLDL